MYLINHDTNREVMAQSANIIFYDKNVIWIQAEFIDNINKVIGADLYFDPLRSRIWRCVGLIAFEPGRPKYTSHQSYVFTLVVHYH